MARCELEPGVTQAVILASTGGSQVSKSLCEGLLWRWLGSKCNPSLLSSIFHGGRRVKEFSGMVRYCLRASWTGENDTFVSREGHPGPPARFR